MAVEPLRMTEKLEEKLRTMQDDNTELTLDNNELREINDRKDFEIRTLLEKLNQERETNVVIRDCISRFNTESSLPDLIKVCANYLLHYFNPSILTFYISNDSVYGNTTTGQGYDHVYDFCENNYNPTHPSDLAEIFNHMLIGTQMYKSLSSFDLKVLREEKVSSAMIFKIQYANRVIGFLLLEYVEETSFDNVNLVNSLLEVFANSYSTLIINKLLANRYGDALTEAYTDLKSGVPNHRQLSVDLDKVTGSAYCVVAMDVDDFKRVNDNYGHDCGDETLAYIGQTLHRYMERLAGKGYREGGDEFFGLSLKPLNETIEVVQEMVKEIWAHEMDDQRGGTYLVTNSIGIYEAQAGEKPEVVKKKADILLYRSKLNGKKQITVDQKVSING